MKTEDEIKLRRTFRNVYHRTTLNFIFIGRWIFNLHNELFKTHGLTLQQYNILKILNGQYPKSATIKLIRERMLDKMSDASRIVENLRKKKLLERDLNNGDRRKVDVVITQKGIDILNLIEKNDSNTMDSFLAKLHPNEVEQLNTLLDKLRD
jgi:DNA-binding MarR family transcriptional regulator